MTWLPRELWLVAGFGWLAVAAGILVGVSLPDLLWSVLLAVGTLLALVAVVWHVFAGGGQEDDAAVTAPWRDDGAIVSVAPERSSAPAQLSGEHLATLLSEATAAARAERRVDDGIAVVREPLRTALVAALEQAGRDRDAIEAALASGEWCDDPTAAWVLDPRAELPLQSRRQRLYAWLFPHRVVRRRTHRAVHEVATVCDEALPSVIGQQTRRTRPVHPPSLDELRRGADGELHRAIDPAAIGTPPAERAGPSSADEPSEMDAPAETGSEDPDAAEEVLRS